MPKAQSLRTPLVWAAGLALAGCVTPLPGPVAPPGPAPAVQSAAHTPKSAAAMMYYAQVQQTLLSQGLMRTDGGGKDAPFTDRMLADNFLRIAMFDEYSRETGGFVRQETASRLRRWEVPIRVGIRFGASIPADKQATDRARIASYLGRLSGLTGHPMSLDEANPNFWIYIVTEDEREALGPKVRAALPNLSPSDVAGITNMPRSTYCLVYALSEGSSGAYTRAFAVIRAEHPDLLRLSCLHEEIAQGLGLANDSPRARPSIFNDDEEFALLTDQDELMLRILYNPALRPGMSLDEAKPIVETLAIQLLGGDS
jgi:Protein of unknown function (DUF2927)